MPLLPVDDKRLPDQEQEKTRDLSQEAANILELLSRQSDSTTLLNICSKAAQAVIKQF